MSRTSVLRPISAVFAQLGAQEPITESYDPQKCIYIKGNPEKDSYVLEIRGVDWPDQVSILEVSTSKRDVNNIEDGEYKQLNLVIDKFIKQCNGAYGDEDDDTFYGIVAPFACDYSLD